MQDPRSQLIKELAKDCKSVADIQERLKSLFKPILQEALEAEMEEHLGYPKHSSEGDNSGNSRNGYSSKTVESGLGQTRIRIPRDRNGEFEPNIIKVDRNVSDLENQMRQIYGVDVSPTMISRITDRVMPLIAEWQSRPLDRVYPIVFLDAIHFKVRQDNRVVVKAAYTVLGINSAGYKDVLGIWIGDSECQLLA